MSLICRERDSNVNGSFDDRYYYLQNWRNDVVAIMNYDGAIKERMFYDAYGRPHCFSPGDLKGGGGSGNDRPDGLLNSSDTWTTGSAAWNKDIGNASGLAEPDGTVDANDGTTLTNLKAAGFSGGYGILSSSAVGNRKGYAGYEFDTVLNGAAGVDEKPVYHVRHRVLAADTGKWMQKDPLGYVDGMDLYEYCKSAAVSRTDPMGLSCSQCGIPVVINAVRDPISPTPQPWSPVPELDPKPLITEPARVPPRPPPMNLPPGVPPVFPGDWIPDIAVDPVPPPWFNNLAGCENWCFHKLTKTDANCKAIKYLCELDIIMNWEFLTRAEINDRWLACSKAYDDCTFGIHYWYQMCLFHCRRKYPVPWQPEPELPRRPDNTPLMPLDWLPISVPPPPVPLPVPPFARKATR